MPILGMGCSRLGSLLARGDKAVAGEAVQAALDEGLRFFDTANIYGQGSSEAILGRVLPNEGVEICTKAGFVTPLPLWALRMAKPVMRQITQRRSAAQLRGQLAARRAQSYPQNFDPAYLAKSLSGSLRRLRRERTDIFLLHNPSPEVAARNELWRWVDAELARGRIGAFGVSCMGIADDLVWLDHPAVTAAQIPARSVTPVAGGFLADPRAWRLRILVREVVGSGKHEPAIIGEALAAVTAAPHVSVTILGMSSPPHVRQGAALFRAALTSAGA